MAANAGLRLNTYFSGNDSERVSIDKLRVSRIQYLPEGTPEAEHPVVI
jgi:hypothetical protein